MTTPPPYGSVPGQADGYPQGPPPQPGYGPQGYAGPPTGAQPAYGAQQTYGQQPDYGQPPAYGQQFPGYPSAPGYPPAGYGTPLTARRPGMVTAAAVLAFVWGGFAIIAGLIIVAASSVISSAADYCNSTTVDSSVAADCNAVTRYSSGFKIITAGLIVVAILLIWGGVVALTGKNAQILVIGAGVYILLEIVALIISATSAGGFAGSGLVGIAAPVLIVIFMLNGTSKAWFRSKGAKTF